MSKPRLTSFKTFQHHSVVRTSAEAMIRFHNTPNALRVLTPPPLFVQMVKDGRVSLTQGTVVFRLWFGPLPVLWKARHEPGSIPTSFIDRMLTGPMANWEHEHIFLEVDQGVVLTDKIRYTHKAGWRGILTRLVFDGLPLQLLFRYRHWRTKQVLEKVSRVMP
jgi:ligand-binding SRPBCC domain-containing protein